MLFRSDRQVLDADIEVVAPAREIEESGVPFGRIDAELVAYAAMAPRYCSQANSFHNTTDVASIRIGHVWRGKPKVRGPVKQPTSVESCLGACALRMTYHPQRTINEGPFSRRFETHRCLEWAETQTHGDRTPFRPSP